MTKFICLLSLALFWGSNLVFCFPGDGGKIDYLQKCNLTSSISPVLGHQGEIEKILGHVSCDVGNASPVSTAENSEKYCSCLKERIKDGNAMDEKLFDEWRERFTISGNFATLEVWLHNYFLVEAINRQQDKPSPTCALETILKETEEKDPNLSGYIKVLRSEYLDDEKGKIDFTKEMEQFQRDEKNIKKISTEMGVFSDECKALKNNFMNMCKVFGSEKPVFFTNNLLRAARDKYIEKFGNTPSERAYIYKKGDMFFCAQEKRKKKGGYYDLDSASNKAAEKIGDYTANKRATYPLEKSISEGIINRKLNDYAQNHADFKLPKEAISGSGQTLSTLPVSAGRTHGPENSSSTSSSVSTSVSPSVSSPVSPSSVKSGATTTANSGNSSAFQPEQIPQKPQAFLPQQFERATPADQERSRQIDELEAQVKKLEKERREVSNNDENKDERLENNARELSKLRDELRALKNENGVKEESKATSKDVFGPEDYREAQKQMQSGGGGSSGSEGGSIGGATGSSGSSGGSESDQFIMVKNDNSVKQKIEKNWEGELPIKGQEVSAGGAFTLDRERFPILQENEFSDLKKKCAVKGKSEEYVSELNCIFNLFSADLAGKGRPALSPGDAIFVVSDDGRLIRYTPNLNNSNLKVIWYEKNLVGVRKKSQVAAPGASVLPAAPLSDVKSVEIKVPEVPIIKNENKVKSNRPSYNDLMNKSTHPR